MRGDALGREFVVPRRSQIILTAKADTGDWNQIADIEKDLFERSQPAAFFMSATVRGFFGGGQFFERECGRPCVPFIEFGLIAEAKPRRGTNYIFKPYTASNGRAPSCRPMRCRSRPTKPPEYDSDMSPITKARHTAGLTIAAIQG